MRGRKKISIKKHEKYGRLSILFEVEGVKFKCGKTVRRFKCKCNCGSVVVVGLSNLRSGHAKSCGCLVQDNNIKLRRTHGMRNTNIYDRWSGMKSRCLNKNDSSYHKYGARGITICDRWLKFENFYVDMGESGGLQLERIDNELGYSPSNCKWATAKEQANNRRNSRYLVYNGQTRTISEWADILNTDRGLLKERLKRGWSVEDAFQIPVRKYTKHSCGISFKNFS